MKSKIILFLFALPFFGVGVWMGCSIGGSVLDAWEKKQWEPVQATLVRAGYNSHSGDDSTTYEAYAVYNYDFGGQQYTGQRVGLAGGADNVGDYQQDMGRQLSAALGRGESITVFVNPDVPSMAIIDRSLRWGLVGFKLIFFLVFGGFGLGLIIFLLRSPKEKDPTAPKYRDSPWLVNDDWQTAIVKSDSKKTMYFAWGFAAFWNLVSAPLPFVVYAEITEKSNWPALLGLLFPIVGIGLIIWAVGRTREWNRFGPAPVTLDPFPGSIGGHVGGTIDINLPYDVGNRFSVTLSNLRSYVSGSGKNRSRKESAEWQDKQIARASSGVKGSRLTFRFDVPEHLSASDAMQEEDSYYLWRLSVKAELDGVDIDRDYEVPVYKTAESSSQLSNFSVEQARSKQNQVHVKAVEELVNLHYGASGNSMHYPMGRNFLSGFSGMFFGAIFAGVGWYLISYEDHMFMGAIFAGFGVLAVVTAFYMVLNSLEVAQEGGDITSVRRILGIPVWRKRMRRADFRRFEKDVSMKTQSGSKHVVRYSVSAVDQNGTHMTVGEGFRGASEADVAADYIARKFGLSARESDASTASESDDLNLLTAD